MPRNQIDLVILKLKLLQYGLLEELRLLEGMYIKSKSKVRGTVDGDMVNGAEPDSGEEEDLKDFVERQRDFATKSITKAKRQKRDDRYALIRNPAAIAERSSSTTAFLSRCWAR